MDTTGKLAGLAQRIKNELSRYGEVAEPPENPVFEYDLRLPHGAQLIAARLGYYIFPGTSENNRRAMRCSDYPERPTLALIRKMWDSENLACPIAAALGPSNLTVVAIPDASDMRAFAHLARWEDTFGRLPRTRIVKSPNGYQIHMRGNMRVDACSLGEGLFLHSSSGAVPLPGTNIGDGPYRWLRVGDLTAAPDWLFGPRPCLPVRT